MAVVCKTVRRAEHDHTLVGASRGEKPITGNDGGTRKKGRSRKDETQPPNYKTLFRLFNDHAQHHKRVFMRDFVTSFNASQVRNDREAPNGYVTCQVLYLHLRL